MHERAHADRFARRAAARHASDELREGVIATTSRFRFHARASALAALTLSIAAAGCGKTRKAAPIGDVGGEHLLVFCTTRASGTPSEYDVALYDADAGGFRSVVGLNSTYGQSEPCLSDDGGFICFASPRATGSGGSDIYVYGREAEALVATPGLNTAANETYPRFTHDSVRMAFVRDSSGVRRIKLYEPNGDSLIALPGIDSPGGTNDAAPSPDLHGDRLAFQSDRGGAMHVYLWNRAGGVANLPDLAGDTLDAEPAMSADGRWLAFASNRSGGAGGWDVYLYDLQTASFVRLPRFNTAGD